MLRQDIDSESKTYCVRIQDRLAMTMIADSLESVIAEVESRLELIPDDLAKADLAIWKEDRVLAVIRCRQGSLPEAFVLDQVAGKRPTRQGMQSSIRVLMLVSFVAAIIFAALRTKVGVEILSGIVLILLAGTVIGSAITTTYHTIAFLRGAIHEKGTPR
jgi:Flp pilus assembly protein TadB